ncbi:MAG: hypothetical protein HQK60_07165 [Deltaproteobacteria bacterium]|nr:hypothetical protein [Deltaproteobacteria bacterium]
MKKLCITISILLLATVVGYGVLFQKQAKWAGVDESVIKPLAEQAGRTPVDPIINPTGDMLLFVFLLAGIAGGFVAGYYFRELFPPSGSGLRVAGCRLTANQGRENGNSKPEISQLNLTTCNSQPVTRNSQPVTRNPQDV